MKIFDVIIEIGKKRTFASALDWPGWSRTDRDEGLALDALIEYGSRYAQVLQQTELVFQPPVDPSEFVVIERLKGDATTDFGAPSISAQAEKQPLDEGELERYKILLPACWRAFDSAVRRAEGKELRKGPRGGGRELEKIVEHVLGAEQDYLRSLGWKLKGGQGGDRGSELRQTRKEILNALEHAVKEGFPEKGPRGGTIWPARYYVRRAAWHVLDHTWEIEERMISE